MRKDFADTSNILDNGYSKIHFSVFLFWMGVQNRMLTPPPTNSEQLGGAGGEEAGDVESF